MQMQMSLALRRKPFFLITSIFLSFIFCVEYFGYGSSHVRRLPSLSPAGTLVQPPDNDHKSAKTGFERKGNETLLAEAPRYIQAIMELDDTSFDRLACPATNTDRYNYLKTPAINEVSGQPLRTYLFALNLYQSAPILPRLLGSIIEAIRILGPQNCALSIVEGRSTDGTFEILSLLAQDLDKLGLKYYFKSNDIDPHGSGQRIQALADLRNIALNPLIEDQAHFSENTTVIFLNDVIACPDDVLELIHQRVFQQADMTCAMDWAYLGPDPTFYDVWIARGMTGDTFFSIPEDGNWNSAWNLFWNDEQARGRLGAFKPFQVFSCWNGGVAFTAAPILSRKIKFRVHNEGHECFQGEPKLFCKDMWVNGYGRIAVVPSVNFEYTTENGKKIKELKGFVQRWTENEGDDIKIGWMDKPPEQVKCMPNYNNQQWKKWDEGLPENSPPG